jgi:hypothetical protein
MKNIRLTQPYTLNLNYSGNEQLQQLTGSLLEFANFISTVRSICCLQTQDCLRQADLLSINYNHEFKHHFGPYHSSSGSSPSFHRKAGFDPRSGHVGSVVNELKLGWNFSGYFDFFCHFSLYQLLHVQ